MLTRPANRVSQQDMMVPDELYALLASIHAVTCMAVSESYRSSNFNVIGDDSYGEK